MSFRWPLGRRDARQVFQDSIGRYSISFPGFYPEQRLDGFARLVVTGKAVQSFFAWIGSIARGVAMVHLQRDLT